MGSISDFLEDAWLDHALSTSAYTSPTTVALAIGVNASDLGFTEVTNANNYSRVTVAAASFDVAASRTITHNVPITFPTASGSWGTPSVWALFDNASHDSGNLLAYGDITTPTAIGNNDTPSFAAGEIDIAVTANGDDTGMTTDLVHELLDHTFKNLSFTMPTTITVGFATAAQTDTGAVTSEVALAQGYARDSDPAFDVTVLGVTANSGNITFSVSGTWSANVISVFICEGTGSANTDLMFYGVVTSFSAVDGDTVQINAGDLDVTIT